MRLLLDTHTLLWLADGSPRLSEAATGLLADPANELLLSTVSTWEIAIKVNMNKLTLTAPYPAYMAAAVRGYGLTVVPYTQDDCDLYSTLPFLIDKHRDPFDRMLIAQALRQGFTIVGVDDRFDAYGVTRLW